MVPRISYIPIGITCDFGLHLEMPNGMEHIMAKVNNCNTGRFTLGHNQYKPLMNSGLIRKKMNKASLRMHIRINTQRDTR